MMTTKQLFALLSSALLGVAVFLPILSFPVVGNVNYFQNARGDGKIVFVLAIISFILALTKKYKFLVYSGSLSVGIVIIAFISWLVRLSSFTADLEKELAGNPFRHFFARLGGQLIHFEWGWIVLLFGAALVIVAGLIKEDFNLSSAYGWAGRKKCPICAEWIKKEAKKCRFCGLVFLNESIDDSMSQSEATHHGEVQNRETLPKNSISELFDFDIAPFIAESWKGQRPLYKVFWIYYGLLIIFLPALLLILFDLSSGLLIALRIYPFDLITFLDQYLPYQRVGISGYVISLELIVALSPVGIWALVAVWRCAPNCSAVGWKLVARGFVILLFIGLPFAAVERYEAYHEAYVKHSYETQVRHTLREAAIAEENYFAKNIRYKFGALGTGIPPGFNKPNEISVIAIKGSRIYLGTIMSFQLKSTHAKCTNAEWTYDGNTGMIEGGPCP